MGRAVACSAASPARRQRSAGRPSCRTCVAAAGGLTVGQSILQGGALRVARLRRLGGALQLFGAQDAGGGALIDGLVARLCRGRSGAGPAAESAPGRLLPAAMRRHSTAPRPAGLQRAACHTQALFLSRTICGVRGVALLRQAGDGGLGLCQLGVHNG